MANIGMNFLPRKVLLFEKLKVSDLAELAMITFCESVEIDSFKTNRVDFQGHFCSQKIELFLDNHSANHQSCSFLNKFILIVSLFLVPPIPHSELTNTEGMTLNGIIGF
jgi:hypothetical protein